MSNLNIGTRTLFYFVGWALEHLPRKDLLVTRNEKIAVVIKSIIVLDPNIVVSHLEPSMINCLELSDEKPRELTRGFFFPPLRCALCSSDGLVSSKKYLNPYKVVVVRFNFM